MALPLRMVNVHTKVLGLKYPWLHLSIVMVLFWSHTMYSDPQSLEECGFGPSPRPIQLGSLSEQGLQLKSPA